MTLIVEKDIEKYLKKIVESRGGRCEKLTAVSESGIPDRLVILPGPHYVFCELKRPKGGRTSAIQKYQMQKLKDLGCDVCVIHNKEEADALVERLGEDKSTTHKLKTCGLEKAPVD